MPSLHDRIQQAWSAFRNNRDPTETQINSSVTVGYSSSSRPDRLRLSRGNDRSIITAIYNRIAVDAAAVKIMHVRLDENERYKETIHSGLNNCLTLEANTDQTGRQSIQDAVISMFDEGCAALVPIETEINPIHQSSFDVLPMRTAKITQWYWR